MDSAIVKLKAYAKLKDEKLLDELKMHILTAEHAKIDYVEIVDSDSLKPAIVLEGNINVMLAVYINNTRLIDNCMIKID